MKSFFSGQNDVLNSNRENKRFLCFYEDILDSPQPSVPFVIQVQLAARSLRKPVHALQGRREGTVMHFKLPVGHPRALWAPSQPVRIA